MRQLKCKIHKDLTGLIGSTPMLEISRFGKGCSARLLAKLELFNPYSIKDRPVLSMLNEAERSGKLKPGGTVVEATSGNTGMALASICSVRGYRCILCMSDKYSIERRQVLRALGAELVLTPGAEGTAGAKKAAQRIAEKEGAYYLLQHHNPANAPAHYRTTAEEIWQQTDGKLDVFVAALGTGGTITGVGRRLKELNPAIRIIGVEPAEAPFVKEGRWAPHMMMGTSPGFMPEVLDQSVLDDILLVDCPTAYAACREIAHTEGLLVGITSGAVAVAMRRLAELPDHRQATCVGIFCDSGQRYLSVEGLFED